ncbi:MULTISPECIES: Nramp family divalent metal transporter [Methanobacterium]|jgi:Mn2+/Fe2+ NRAMP family transporter|uniref:Nramp family divalent metal transporter n=1 Tax=Methanobacterium veterum TaxID=408577 RepID=A0A9E4ZW96_9EURY|nr:MULTISPECIES: Nramp family divalent metal transporter [Methanobacterium]MCZ3365492.1 Nramp family divalent metal transporter [Methanobacterium veterum]MCZ3373244.1 Nramp family divalent metal transporter [Methanobacterium veterum]
MDIRIFTRVFKHPIILSLIVFLSVMGPGIITANVDNDAGGITTYSLAGSQFGYDMLWLFIPMIIALAIIQEMGVRMGIVSGKGLADLIREKVGLKLTFVMMIALLAANMGNILAEFSGIAVSSGIFGVPKFVALPVAALFVWLLVVKGTYKSVEKVFLLASLVYLSYIVAGYLSQPDWALAAHNLVVPQISLNTAYITMIIGLVGTTIAPWMMFYIQSSVVEKGITLKNLKYSKLDAVFGAIVVNIVAFFIVIACAATINANGIQVNDVVDVSTALVPLAGQYASLLFAFGFLNASLFAASILPLSTAYYVCESLGFEAGVSKSFREAPVFHGLYLGLIILAVIVIMLPNVPLLSILYLSQVANGILLPFLLILMLLIINDKRIMGEHVNSRLFNYIAWATVVIVMGLSISLVITSFFPT